MSEPTPPVAVVIPVYNMARYLAPCLDSVLAQTIRTSASCRGRRLDGRVARDSCRVRARHANLTVIRQSNKGLAGARNTGIRAALGAPEHFDYVFFFDSDDLLKENTLSTCVSAALTHRCDLVTCGVQCFDKTATRPLRPFRRRPHHPSGSHPALFLAAVDRLRREPLCVQQPLRPPAS